GGDDGAGMVEVVWCGMAAAVMLVVVTEMARGGAWQRVRW
ncbi:hypothetical protein Tco_0547188, partial [Tanacetum coccineum]